MKAIKYQLYKGDQINAIYFSGKILVMRLRNTFLFIIAMMLFQSQSCNNHFHKDPLSEDELWWNEQNEIWQELFLRESGHLGDKMTTDILNEIL